MSIALFGVLESSFVELQGKGLACDRLCGRRQVNLDERKAATRFLLRRPDAQQQPIPCQPGWIMTQSTIIVTLASLLTIARPLAAQDILDNRERSSSPLPRWHSLPLCVHTLRYLLYCWHMSTLYDIGRGRQNSKADSSVVE